MIHAKLVAWIVRYSNLPTKMESQLLPFQRSGVQFCLRHGGRGLIGDEMGLGKTVQALAVAACYKDEWPMLVVTTSSLRCTFQSSQMPIIDMLGNVSLFICQKHSLTLVS